MFNNVQIIKVTILMALILSLGNVVGQSVTIDNTNDLDKLSGELILGAPKTSEKNLAIITDVFAQIKGVEYLMFCPEHRLILAKYDIKTYKTVKDVYQVILNQDISMPLQLKEGTFEGVMEMCNKNSNLN